MPTVALLKNGVGRKQVRTEAITNSTASEQPTVRGSYRGDRSEALSQSKVQDSGAKGLAALSLINDDNSY